MASLPNTITIEMQLRPCEVYFDGEKFKAVFHKWVTVSKSTARPEIMTTKGVVELYDGSVILAIPEHIIFTDGLAKTILESTNTLHIADDTPENKIF